MDIRPGIGNPWDLESIFLKMVVPFTDQPTTQPTSTVPDTMIDRKLFYSLTIGVFPME